ncbi:MAG: DUF4388 domain-containing protein [Acidobacteria bacterium]|nr:DUF4388 domain-containing protein [Acidobacteriota bacterium]
MLLKGSLKVTTLPEILHSICISKETGILTLQQFNVKKKIYFEEGKIAFAYSNQRKDSLGDVLLRSGTIALEMYLKTADQIRPGLRHGQILLREKVITTQQLITAVHSQVQDIIFSLFHWVEGTFEFEKEEKNKETIKLNISSSDLILSGVKRITDWSIISKMIGAIDNVMEESPEFETKLSEIQLDDQENDIVKYAVGRSIEDVLGYSLLNDYETCRLLAGFITIDLFRIRKSQFFILEPVTDIDTDKLKRMADLFNNIYRHIQSTLRNSAGPMAEKILKNYYMEVRQTEKELLKNVEMKDDGALDSDLLDLNLMNLEMENKTERVYQMYLKVLSSLLKAARELLGGDEMSRLDQEIKELVERMSATTEE